MLKFQKWVFGCSILLLVVVLTLFFFIFQQCYYISINKTQVELDKYEIELEERKKNKDLNPIINIYDKGFFKNWKEFLFPSKILKHEPFKIKK